MVTSGNRPVRYPVKVEGTDSNPAVIACGRFSQRLLMPRWRNGLARLATNQEGTGSIPVRGT
jgi:hypothetical protein